MLYRAEMTDPAAGFMRGLQSWSAIRGGATNNDLLSHLYGESFSNPDGPASNWVSTSSDMDYIRDWMGTMATGLHPPYSFWVYQIQANPHAYSTRWALEEYLIRNMEQASYRVATVQVALNRPSDPHEWAYLGGVGPSDIRGAVRWNYDAASRRYVESGEHLLSNHFIERLLPPPSTENPLDLYIAAPVGAAQVYNPGISADADASGTMATALDLTMSVPLNLTMSCTATHPANPPSSRKKTIATDQCSVAPMEIKKYTKSSIRRKSVLAFNLPGGPQCLTPQLYNGYVGAGFVQCGSEAYRFEYDEFKRLSVFWKKNLWCLAAPESVVNDTAPYWDYLHFEPCALNSNVQKWVLKNGQIQSYTGNYRLQEYSGSAMLSRTHDGNPVSLNKRKFSRGFFSGPSPSRSHQVELKMSWLWNGNTSYSNTQITGHWNNFYWNRSYYDYNKQSISYLFLRLTTSNSDTPPIRYCLSSQPIQHLKTTWKWTQWIECNDTDAKVQRSAKWELTSLADAVQDPLRVQWRNLDHDPLWVQAVVPPNTGAYFTTYGSTAAYIGNSTNQFAIRPDALRMGPRFAPEAP